MNSSSAPLPSLILRWTARISSLVSLGLMLAFAFGQGFNPAALSLKEILLFACFPVAAFIGLAIAWVRPLTGGTLCILGLVGFYVLHLAFTGRLPAGFAFLLFVLPGWLFVISEFLSPVRCQEPS